MTRVKMHFSLFKSNIFLMGQKTFIIVGQSTLNFPTAEELRCHARLQGESANGYLRQLAILRITHEDATELTNRIKELTAKSTGSTTLPLRQSDYTPEQAKAFTSHQSTVLARLIPHDTSSTHSANREWEVGKQSHYDHIDNQQSGTQLTM